MMEYEIRIRVGSAAWILLFMMFVAFCLGGILEQHNASRRAQARAISTQPVSNNGAIIKSVKIFGIAQVKSHVSYFTYLVQDPATMLWSEHAASYDRVRVAEDASSAGEWVDLQQDVVTGYDIDPATRPTRVIFHLKPGGLAELYYCK